MNMPTHPTHPRHTVRVLAVVAAAVLASCTGVATTVDTTTPPSPAGPLQSSGRQSSSPSELMPASSSELTPASSSPTGLQAPQSAPQVVTKQEGAPPPPSNSVWAAWTDTQDGLDQLWSTLLIDEGPTPPAPTLVEGRAIVLAATGEGQDCPTTLTSVEFQDSVLELIFRIFPEDPSTQIGLSPTEEPTFVCRADFNPVTFIVEVDPQATQPPITVDFGRESVRIEEPDIVVSQ